MKHRIIMTLSLVPLAFGLSNAVERDGVIEKSIPLSYDNLISYEVWNKLAQNPDAVQKSIKQHTLAFAQAYMSPKLMQQIGDNPPKLAKFTPNIYNNFGDIVNQLLSKSKDDAVYSIRAASQYVDYDSDSHTFSVELNNFQSLKDNDGKYASLVDALSLPYQITLRMADLNSRYGQVEVDEDTAVSIYEKNPSKQVCVTYYLTDLQYNDNPVDSFQFDVNYQGFSVDFYKGCE